MLDVSAARAVVLAHATRLRPEVTAVMSSALGQVLAEDVPADRDSPPFAKATMDGFAVRAGDGNAERRVVGEIAAGSAGGIMVGAGEAARIFTGAPVPPGADAVVMVEKTRTAAPDRVAIDDPGPTAGQYVLTRGAEMAAGDVVLPAGTVLTPAAFGLLAAVGRTTVKAYPAPRVGVLATGNELVEANMTPGPAQIRNSNGPMLVAQTVRAGGLPRYLGIARDDEASLASFIREGLITANVLVLAGGVSTGGLDLVPQVLASLGVTVHFHHVKMKPGKPMLFGTKDGVLVFGLPGNPVSALVGFELFVKPALRALGGHADPGPRAAKLPLAAAFAADNNRPTYHPAEVVGTAVRPLPWFGSPDLRGVRPADAFVVLPAGSVSYAAGDIVEVVLI